MPIEPIEPLVRNQPMLQAILTLALAIAFAAAPFVTSPFTGFTADQLPVPQIDPPVQPAGYAFAIWGLIYLWLIVSAAYGVWRRAEDGDWARVRPPLLLALAVGVPWLAIANSSAIWATVTIAVMAVGAIAAMVRAPLRDTWVLLIPVSIFAGWLSAASFVSLASTAAGYGLIADGYGWAFIGIGAALITALSVQRLAPGAWAYSLTVIWALIAIVVKNWGGVPSVAAFAAGAALILAINLAVLHRRGHGPATG